MGKKQHPEQREMDLRHENEQMLPLGKVLKEIDEELDEEDEEL